MALTHVESAILGAIVGPIALVALLWAVQYRNRPQEYWDAEGREKKNYPNTCGRIALWVLGIIILLALGATIF
jgi:heme/copper-type cytochrome/quinol oxidase subunit 2